MVLIHKLPLVIVTVISITCTSPVSGSVRFLKSPLTATGRNHTCPEESQIFICQVDGSYIRWTFDSNYYATLFNVHSVYTVRTVSGQYGILAVLIGNDAILESSSTQTTRRLKSALIIESNSALRGDVHNLSCSSNTASQVHQIHVAACTATLSPVGDVNMCVGQPQTFLCSVSNEGPAARLEWRVEFKDSRSVPDVIQTFTLPTYEYLIRDDRDGVSFEFNLTSNSSRLESTMTVMVSDDNGTTLINNATLYCGHESDLRAVIHIHRGPPSPVTNLSNELIVSQFTRDNATLVKINWSPMAFADQYIIDVLPFVISVSTFITTNTAIQLTLLYNQEYNISVVATNCAGNSTPTFMIIRIGCCLVPLIDSMVVVEESSICAIEDSYITYHCQPDAGILIPVLTVSLLVFSVITFFAGGVLGILCIKCFSKTLLAYKNKNNSTSATTTSTTPVYEEILPEITTQVNRDPETFVQNEAYEPIQINNN